jgi:hypothetical protein
LILLFAYFRGRSRRTRILSNSFHIKSIWIHVYGKFSSLWGHDIIFLMAKSKLGENCRVRMLTLEDLAIMTRNMLEGWLFPCSWNRYFLEITSIYLNNFICMLHRNWLSTKSLSYIYILKENLIGGTRTFK